MEAVVEKANMEQAYRRVVANKGASGADGMSVDQLADHIKEHWLTLRERLLAGEYHPSPIRRDSQAQGRDATARHSHGQAQADAGQGQFAAFDAACPRDPQAWQAASPKSWPPSCGAGPATSFSLM